jgi:hypothetical protein
MGASVLFVVRLLLLVGWSGLSLHSLGRSLPSAIY